MTFRGNGKCVVVTGGASGIGEACVAILRGQGYKVAILDKDMDKAQRVAGALGAVAYFVDVADADSVDHVVDRVEREWGLVNALVTSAGIAQRSLPPEELPIADWDKIISVDFRGSYLCCRAFGNRMARRSGGSIVNIASVTGSRSAPLHAYAPAKAAVISMTKCLAAEWGPCSVRVNSVSPGYTLTPLLREAIALGQRDPSALISNSALGRMVEPWEVGEAVAFLISDMAGAITGVGLPVDAGWLVAPSWNTYGGLRAGKRVINEQE